MSHSVLRELEGGDIPLLNESQMKFMRFMYTLVEESAQKIEKKKDLPRDANLKLQSDIKAVEEHFSDIINHLKLGRASRKAFIQTFPKWLKIRKDSIEKLRNLADSMNEHRHNCNISKLVGYCVSFLGGTLTVAAAALIPFTLGLSTPLAIAGGVTTGTGCTTALGTSFTELGIMSKKIKKAKKILEKDRECFNRMNDWLRHAQELEEVIDKVMEMDFLRDAAQTIKKMIDGSMKIKNDFQRLLHMRNELNVFITTYPAFAAISNKELVLVMMILSAIYMLIKHSDNRLVFDCASVTVRAIIGIISLADDTLDIFRLSSLFTSGTIPARTVAAAVTRGAVAAIGIALDVAGIAVTSVDVHKGSVSPVAKKIKKACDEMEDETKVLQDVYNKMTKIKK